MSGRLLLLNKPYHVLTQFTDEEGRQTLANFVDVTDVYAAGRLDYDSEGLVVLTNLGWLQSHIAEPRYKLPKTYWAQVEGIPTHAQLRELAQGVLLKDGLTLPASVQLLESPPVWPRTPPIRVRKSIPDAWIELTIVEGRNRQVRRMTAAVGLPALRLIRVQVGPWTIAGMEPGSCKELPCPSSPQDITPDFFAPRLT